MQESYKKIVLILSILTALITFLVYLPALQNGFVNWDDQVYVYKNVHIRSMDISFFKWAFTSVVSANWHPLTVISYGIDYLIWGLNPLGYHLTNIVFHAANAFLVFLIIFRLAIIKLEVGSRKKGLTDQTKRAKAVTVAVITSLLFGLHPLHVESVAWVSERKDVLSSFFFFLSIIAYIKYTSDSYRKNLFYVVSLLLFALSLMSKPMTISLPIVLLILDIYPLERSAALNEPWGKIKEFIIEKIPFFLLSGLSAVITLWAQKKGEALVGLAKSPFIERLSIAVHGYVFYIYKLLLPLNLAPVYPRLPYLKVFGTASIAYSVILIGITIFCIVLIKRERIFISVWLYYIITLFPVIGIVQVSDHIAADRYTYLPSIGPFILIGAATAYTIGKKKYIVPGAVFILIVLGTFTDITLKQISVWKNPISLWSREIELFPVLPAYRLRAEAYFDSGKYREALVDYTTVIKNDNKNLPNAYLRRGLAFQNLGYFKMALKDFDTSIKLKPENFSAYIDRGNLNRKLGNLNNAIKDYRKAISLNPEIAAAYYNLALVYLDIGKTGIAIKNMEKAASMGLKEATDYMKNLNNY